ncbi:WYL domain-containing protein [Paenibacillus nanensis]|uniref:WYL domain-containing protein n=1 Tax=Paenibacillus nanensis TaxID=393251 RepID=A0A3A1VKL3_9BACL|nr:WYL domain-containing protein [Paenibacillus nanensis]RIX60176.1 WYL domain-containing protein [Paenibacillus nanensis]
MARESFDKEIQFLRLLALTGGAYSRKQFADRLGISVHTYDKTLRYLKDILSAGQQGLTPEQSAELTAGFRYNHYESADPLLLFLYRAKSLKETESARLALIMAALRKQDLAANDLMELCGRELPADAALPDEKTIRGDLKYLEEVGVVKRIDGKRPYRYRARTELIDQLTDDELIDLYDYTDVLANTQLPSVQGYLLRDTLKKALRARGLGPETTETHVYKYHYHSRILDEAHLYAIHKAIESRRKLTFLYLSPKRGTRYASKNTNPLFETQTTGVTETILPLKVIYDHQYGRWYLVGHNARQGLMKFRMEGLTGLEEGAQVSEEEFAMRLSHAEEKLRHSWVIDTMRSFRVVARFYNPENSSHNFVKARVLAQGQWGEITEETESFFQFEITVNGLTEIKPWLRSFGSSCEVLEPRWLRHEFMAEWKELQAYYEPVREDF